MSLRSALLAFTKLLPKRLNFRSFRNFHRVPSYKLCAVGVKESQCEETRNSLSAKKIREINFFCKTVTFTKFLSKKLDRKFP